jgi:hypothetical protein
MTKKHSVVGSLKYEITLNAELTTADYEVALWLPGSPPSDAAAFEFDIPGVAPESVKDLEVLGPSGRMASVVRRSRRNSTRLVLEGLRAAGQRRELEVSIRYNLPSRVSLRRGLLHEFAVLPIGLEHPWPIMRLELLVNLPHGVTPTAVTCPPSASRHNNNRFTESTLPSGSHSEYLLQVQRRRDYWAPLGSLAFSVALHELAAGAVAEVYHQTFQRKP